METLGNGMTEGLQRNLILSDFTILPSELHPFETHKSEHIVLCVRPRDTAWMKKTSSELVNAGKCVSVVQLLHSPRYFQVVFKDGYWLHRGGVFGKSDRSQPLVQITSYQQRFASEIRRISSLYSVDIILNSSDHEIEP
jgi:hypothetical protein